VHAASVQVGGIRSCQRVCDYAGCVPVETQVDEGRSEACCANSESSVATEWKTAQSFVDCGNHP